MDILIFMSGGILGSLLTLGIIYLDKVYDANCIKKRNTKDCERNNDGYCANCHSDYSG